MGYHEGELEAQRRAGVSEMAAKVGRIIGDTIPAAAAAFLARRTFVITATIAADGAVHASMIGGAAGFCVAAAPQTLVLKPTRGDVAAVRADIEATGTIGLLAIDFAMRRRVRANGRAVVRDGAIVVTTQEVYSNCPQYIQERDEVIVGGGESRLSAQLDAAQIERIAAADTFFIATAHAERGADASHRGGHPGFVAATPSTISWPDYPGNNMFNTIGNLLSSDRCSVLFADFTDGSTLRVDGRAVVRWDAPRRIELQIETVVDQGHA